MIDGLIAANAPEDVIQRAIRDSDGSISEDCEIWPENWRTVQLFLTVGTQWIITPDGRPMGIDYTSLESAMNINNIRKMKRPSLFYDIRVMEDAAMHVFRNKQ